MISGIKKGLIGASGILVAVSSLGFALPAQADDGDSNPGTLPPGQYSGAGGDIDGWSCDMTATGSYAPCVQTEPTSGDEAWQKGYKLTFNWSTPLDWQGNPYQRCVLSYYNPATDYSAESMAPIQLDVAAAWGSYTMPLARYGWLEDGITAGATTLKEEYYCYTPNVGSSERFTTNSAIIPDMPPTTPTAVDATATQSNVAEANATVTVETGSADLTRATATTSNAAALDLLVSGSKALGVAPLDGYQLAVTNDSSGATVATVKIAPKAATKSVVAQAARGTVAGKGNLVNGATGAVRNLQPGTYTLRVASYNRIGVSDPYTVKLVVQRGGKVAVVKHLTATVKHAAVSAKWAGVSGATGYVLQAVKGSKIIKTVRVGAKTRAANIKLSKGSYTLRVASLRGNRASVPVSSQVRVR